MSLQPDEMASGGASAASKVSGKNPGPLEILAQMGKSLLGVSFDTQERLRLTLDLAIQALSASRGSVMVVDAESQTMQIRVATGLPDEALESSSPVGEGIAGWVAANNEPVVVHGDFKDPRFAGVDPTIESSLSLPLAVEGRVFGVLNIVRPSGQRFTDDDLRLASSLADLAALAMEKAELYESITEKEARASSLLRAAIHAQERERSRIAADIHDGFLQDLSAVFLKAESANMQLRLGDTAKVKSEIADIKSMIQDEVQALRDYIFEVRPPSLDEIGLGPTLKAMADRTASDKLERKFSASGSDERLPGALETILYRVAQEALRNVKKHAKATRFEVELKREVSRVTLIVKDDGRGFDAAQQHQGHFGIETMRERVELAGGRFVVESDPSKGTSIKAVLPLNGAVRLSA